MERKTQSLVSVKRCRAFIAQQEGFPGIINPGKFDGFVKSRFYLVFVIPAKAGIQLNQAVLGSRLRGSHVFADFFRDHQI